MNKVGIRVDETTNQGYCLECGKHVPRAWVPNGYFTVHHCAPAQKRADADKKRRAAARKSN